MKPLSERIKDFPANQFVDWLCLSCVDVREVNYEEDAQDEINKIRQAVTERLTVLEQQRDALAAENAILKNGIGFFSYGSDSGFEEHDSAEKAIAAADSDIDYYRGDACDGWSEETDQTVWGVILQRATMIDERPRTEEDSYLGSHISSICDYALLPNLATPATDAYLNSVRAEGVDKAIEHLHEKFSSTGHIGVPVMALESLAAQIRAGKDGE